MKFCLLLEKLKTLSSTANGIGETIPIFKDERCTWRVRISVNRCFFAFLNGNPYCNLSFRF
jgi:hypothetical protein